MKYSISDSVLQAIFTISNIIMISFAFVITGSAVEAMPIFCLKTLSVSESPLMIGSAVKQWQGCWFDDVK